MASGDMEGMLKDVMAKNQSLMGEKDGLQNQIKILMKRVKDLEGEAEDALASAEAANMSKSSVEKDWTERLVKVRPLITSSPTPLLQLWNGVKPLGMLDNALPCD